VQFETDSTISAIATGNTNATGGQGALRGAVRISGQDTLTLLVSLFPNLSEDLHKARHAKRFSSSLELSGLGTIGVDVFFWPDHRSYTAQPSAELHLLGAPVFLEEVQAKVLKHGARLARPGEFTLRAFLAGRLDLTQCEAVLGLIHAHSQREFQVALSQLAGGLAVPLKDLRNDLINLLADLEAGLDFVDEDIAFVQTDEILARLQRAEQQVTKLRDQIENRHAHGLEFQIAFVGPPNAGKSSLVNALSDSDASIVSPQPGTTRDYVRTRVCWAGTQVALIDTAGIENVFQTGPRAIAQEKTLEVIQQADLVVACLGVEQSMAINKLVGLRRLWGVWTKCDLTQAHPLVWPLHVHRSFTLSAQTGEGIAEFRNALVDAIEQWQHNSLDVVPMTGVRCKSALAQASESLAHARQATLDSAGEEIIAGELRLALDELGEVAGTVANNDILDALFSRFCIGK